VVLFFVANILPANLSAAEPGSSANPLEGVSAVFDDLQILGKDPSPVVCLIDCTDPSELKDTVRGPAEWTKVRQLRARIEEISGLPCLVFHYMQLKRDDLSKPNVQAIVLRAWKDLKDELHRGELYAMLRENDVPTIGFCGGQHQICIACDGKVGTMRKLRPGEKDPNPGYYPGEFKEWGPVAIKILKRDPIFEGFGDQVVMIEMHCGECKKLPPDFENLASSEECKIQVIKHKQKFLYGTQFHPEVYDGDHPDGRTLISNFLNLARHCVASRLRACFAQLFGEADADAINAAYDAMEDVRRGYSSLPCKPYGPNDMSADLRRIDKALRGLNKTRPASKSAPAAAEMMPPEEVIALLKRNLTAIRSVCQWRAEMGRTAEIKDYRKMMEAYKRCRPPELSALGERSRIEREFVLGGGDFGRDPRNVVMTVDLAAREQRYEIKGWSDRIDTPLLGNLAYRQVDPKIKKATICMRLDPGACLVQVTAYNSPDAGCAILLEDKPIAQFGYDPKLPEGWFTKTYPMLLQTVASNGHLLTFVATAKKPLPMLKVLVRRLRLASSS
jgi:GMP synthase (glutamine-hydrolysing)